MYEPVTAVKGGNPVMEGVMRMPSNTTGREVYQFSLRCGGHKAVPQQPCQYLNKCIYYYLTTINTSQICNINIQCKPLIIGINQSIAQ